MRAPTDFIYAYFGEAMADRLAMVNRRFEAVVDIGGRALPYARLPAGAATTTIPTFWDLEAEALPLTDHMADLVVSNLSLHSINDLPGALVQVRRALKPDGLFLGTLLGGNSLAELRDALLIAESQITGRAYPRVAPMADVRDLGNLLGRAGLNLPVADSETLTVTYAHLFALMDDLRALGWQNSHAGRARHFLRRDVMLRAAEIYAEKYPADGGRITASFEVITLTAWHPHASQQKPLKPGSGTIGLAEALAAGQDSKPR